MKIRTTFQDGEGNTEVESLWARAVPEGYEVDNIPFYVLGLACGDVVSTRQDSDGDLWVKAVVRKSGNSNVRL